MTKPAAGRSAVSRREFVKLGVGTGAALALNPLRLFAAENAPAGTAGAAALPTPEVWVIHDADPAKLMRAAWKIMGQNGGLGPKLDKLTLKVNAAWDRNPEEGANTHPVLVDTFLELCRAAGVKKVVMPELTCAPAAKTFANSGIQAAADKHQAELIDLSKHKDHFVPKSIPGAKSLKEVMVGKDFLETDVLINMPVAKNHGAATFTCGLKNWMGAVQDRGFWHKNNMHQCIADIGLLLKPAWTIVDATRVMATKGPQGGPTAEIRKPEQLILSRSPIAADAVASTILFESPAKVKYLVLAAEMGLGVIDPAAMKIHRLEAAAVLA